MNRQQKANFDQINAIWWVKVNGMPLFSQFFVMGNYLVRKYPHLVHNIYTPRIEVIMNTSILGEYEAKNWIPPAAHWWLYYYCLSDDFTKKINERFKFGKLLRNWTDFTDEVILRGKCLKARWRSSRSEIDCSVTAYTEVHPMLKLYPSLPFNLDVYKDRYYSASKANDSFIDYIFDDLSSSPVKHDSLIKATGKVIFIVKNGTKHPMSFKYFMSLGREDIQTISEWRIEQLPTGVLLK